MAKRKGDTGGDYDRFREQQAAISRRRSEAGREIGPLPPVADPDRRQRGRESLEDFCRTYFCERFPLPFSDAHRQAIRRMEEVTTGGGRFALSLMRGGGKTSLAEIAVLRAVLYGFRRFALLVQATQPLAGRSLKKILRELEGNDRLAEDFPEVCGPIRALERIHNRARGQTCDGEPTGIELTADWLVLPTVRGSAASGAVLCVAGLTGAVRGLSYTSPTGAVLRPDLVVLDDVQTRESAKSPTQTADRVAIVTDDILGLAGPTTEIAAVMLVTPIMPGDLAERFLDPERHPEWQGQRTRMLEVMPTDLAAWDEYAEVRRAAYRSGLGGEAVAAAAAEYYLANRGRLDASAVATWPERFKPGEVSAVQSGMNLYLDNPRGFWAEYQCDAEKAQPATAAKGLAAEAVAGRLSGTERFAVPAECDRVTVGVDVGRHLIYYAVAAWDGRFGGTVIDYGTFPRQARSSFSAADARPGLPDRFPGLTDPQLVYAALSELLPELLGREYLRDGGGSLKVGRCLVDCGWQTAAVAQAVRASPFAATIYPSKGIGRSATSVGVARWRLRPGERAGWHWKLTTGEAGTRTVQLDSDAWKSCVFDRLTTPPGGAGALTLFGRKRPGGAVADHSLFAEHLAAETAEPMTVHGETFDKWSQLPHRPDNHWLDTLTLAAVAASVDGLVLHPNPSAAADPAGPPKPVKWSEVQKQRLAERAAAGPR